MSYRILESINHYNSRIVILDIDGTLKDLCKEHSNAVQITLGECCTKSFNQKIVIAINKIAMAMVASGLLPTNVYMQNLLVKAYAIIAGVNIKLFYSRYFQNYIEQVSLFDGVCELLQALQKSRTVYFATINKQNYNLEKCGIPQERIVYTEGALKLGTYSQLLKSFEVEKQDVVIVGDNIFDDLLSAKLLGVKCVLVNHYNSKLKNLICKMVNSK